MLLCTSGFLQEDSFLSIVIYLFRWLIIYFYIVVAYGSEEWYGPYRHRHRQYFLFTWNWLIISALFRSWMVMPFSPIIKLNYIIICEKILFLFIVHFRVWCCHNLFFSNASNRPLNISFNYDFIFYLSIALRLELSKKSDIKTIVWIDKRKRLSLVKIYLLLRITWREKYVIRLFHNIVIIEVRFFWCRKCIQQ